MNILHLLSQTQLTGAEIYAASLIDKQSANHRCFIISDTLNCRTKAQYQPLAVDNRSAYSRIKNARALFHFCRKHHIDVIHSHSRAASWLAHYIAKLLSIKHIASVHGIQGIHFSSKRQNVYGQYIITVCEYLQQHLMRDLNIASSSITLIRNGFDMVYTPSDTPLGAVKKIAWVGRLTGPKGQRIKHLTHQVFSQFPHIEFHCFGGPDDCVAEHQKNAPSNCHFIGQVADLAQALKPFSVVFASGRAALEAMFLNKAVYAVGEACALGFVNESTADACRRSNFGDCGHYQSFQSQRLIDEVNDFLNNPQLPNYQTILSEYHIDRVYQQVMALYQA